MAVSTRGSLCPPWCEGARLSRAAGLWREARCCDPCRAGDLALRPAPARPAHTQRCVVVARVRWRAAPGGWSAACLGGPRARGRGADIEDPATTVVAAPIRAPGAPRTAPLAPRRVLCGLPAVAVRSQDRRVLRVPFS